MQEATHEDKRLSDSSAKACFDFWGGPTKHLSFDCPENLKTAFKQVTKAQSQSVCSVLQSLMIAFIVSSQACFSNTIKPQVTIESLSLERVTQRHRRVAHEFEEDVDKVVVANYEKTFCGRCKKEASVLHLARFVSGGKFYVCDDCLKWTYNHGLVRAIY